MSRTGPGTPTLSERLAAKTALDREEMRAAILSEHRRFVESLRSASRAAHALMESDMAAHRTRMASSMRVLLHWPLWTAGLCMIVVLASIAVLWVGTWWMRAEWTMLRSAIASEKATLETLQGQTHGITFTKGRDGRTFVLFPEGTDTDQMWTCSEGESEKKCLPLPGGS